MGQALQEWSTYFDVRLFRNPFDDILRPIINELEKRYGASIFPEPEGSYDYAILQAGKRIPAIKAELEEALKARETFLRIKCVPKLDFRIGWGSNFAQRYFDPYERAFIDHKSVFNKADQFVRTGPFILFLVVPPWEYGNILWIRDLDLTCYRALCRRVFCQYIGLMDISDKHQHTYDEVSRAISMVIILNLHDTLNRMEEIMIARAYANPNANHPFPSRIRQFLSEQKIPLDDFEWDNY